MLNTTLLLLSALDYISHRTMIQPNSDTYERIYVVSRDRCLKMMQRDVQAPDQYGNVSTTHRREGTFRSHAIELSCNYTKASPPNFVTRGKTYDPNKYVHSKLQHIS